MAKLFSPARFAHRKMRRSGYRAFSFEKEIFKGEIVDLNYKLPEDSYPGTASEPWKVYCVIQFKVGTWTEDSWIKHFDQEDVLIYSIDDDKLEKLDDYKKTITKP